MPVGRPERRARVAPPGSVVGITYDSDSEVCIADALKTSTGRLYLVVQSRRQERGKHAGRRWHLRCLVMESAGVPEGVRVHDLYWYRRERKRS